MGGNDRDEHRPMLRRTFTLTRDNKSVNTADLSTGGYMSQKYHHSPRSERDRRVKITINVSGERYQTYVETLDKFPKSLLGNKNKREQFYDDVEDEYFFDRDRSAFNAILYYYQSKGQLYCPLTVPMTILVSEAQFFELGTEAIKQVLDLQCENSSLLMPKQKWQRRLWCLFEHPETSRGARIITIVSVSMIILSVITLCVETLPYFKPENLIFNRTTDVTSIMASAELNLKYGVNGTQAPANNSINSMLVSKATAVNNQCSCACSCLDRKSRTKVTNTNQSHLLDWKQMFEISEAIFVTWFTLEFIMRFISSPNKKDFIKAFLNVIDILSILPFYFQLAATKHGGSLGLENFRVIRLVRVFRIFKLSRHSKGLQILGQTLKASMKELGLLIFFIGIGVILFSSAIYYLEVDNFTSIPDAFWWAIITMCTVGYGDMVPKTVLGKIVGGACSVCGVLSIALPVPVIVSNFDYFYNRERTKKMHKDVLNATRPSTPQTDDIVCDDKSDASDVPVKHESRNDEIQRQATIKGLEKRSRKVSQKLSSASMQPTQNTPIDKRKNGVTSSHIIALSTD